jgi:hypothetical protein
MTEPLQPDRPARDRTGWGVLYVAIGASHLEEARASAASVKRQMPDLSTTVFTDLDRPAEEFDIIELIRPERFTYGVRIDCLRRTPYQRTLHIDTDTRLCADVSELFEVLEDFDVGGIAAPRKPQWGDEKVPECFSQINGGVILYRSTDGVFAWLDDWLRLYEEDLGMGEKRLTTRLMKRIPSDQPSLRITLYKSGLRLIFLPTEYNCRFRMPGYLTDRVKIVHGDVRELDRAAVLLNESTAPRIHYRGRGGRLVVKPGKWELLLARILSRRKG